MKENTTKWAFFNSKSSHFQCTLITIMLHLGFVLVDPRAQHYTMLQDLISRIILQKDFILVVVLNPSAHKNIATLNQTEGICPAESQEAGKAPNYRCCAR
jgi:hypothetical protein